MTLIYADNERGPQKIRGPRLLFRVLVSALALECAYS